MGLIALILTRGVMNLLFGRDSCHTYIVLITFIWDEKAQLPVGNDGATDAYQTSDWFGTMVAERRVLAETQTKGGHEI